MRTILVLILFLFSFFSRWNLVDTYYLNSFEPDSHGCIERTRSFYFFFMNPIKENYPHTLSSYPSYYDGAYIFSSLFAHGVKYAAKHCPIFPALSDSDNSLIVFSMRWSGVVLDALSVVLILLILTSITGNQVLAIAICMLYFAWNIQLLAIDSIRVDHYTSFTAILSLWAAIRLFMFPKGKWRAICFGIACGLVSATKLNFFFYLFFPSLVFLYMAYKRTFSIKQILLIFLSFSIVFVFMFQRWFYYSDKIMVTLTEIIQLAEDWVDYWGISNHNYYHWEQFFSKGHSISGVFVLILFYAAFGYVFVRAIYARNTLFLFFCISFSVHSIALILSPKVERYAIIIPVWVSIFCGIGLSYLLTNVHSKTIKFLLVSLCFISFGLYSINNYQYVKLEAYSRNISKIETRIAAANWMTQNVTQGSSVLIQRPIASNPPIFNLFYSIDDRYLSSNFLNKETFCLSEPPSIMAVRNCSDYILICDKEKDYFINTMKQFNCSANTLRKWESFFDSLPMLFAEQIFMSKYKNYGVSKYWIYTVNANNKKDVVSTINTLTSYDSMGNVYLNWNYLYKLGHNPYCFQVQVSEDSAFQRLVYGSRDGYDSKYRRRNNPVWLSSDNYIHIPKAIQEAFRKGKFNYAVEGLSLSEIQLELDDFFAGILLNMKEQQVTFGESISKRLEGDETVFKNDIVSTLGEKDAVLNARFEEFIALSGLKLNAQQITGDIKNQGSWTFRLPIKLGKKKCYFWRVRFKVNEKVKGVWSNVGIIKDTII